MWFPEPATSLSGNSSDLLQEYHTSFLLTDIFENTSPSKQSEVSCNHIMLFLQTQSNSQVFQVASSHAETGVGRTNTKVIDGSYAAQNKKKNKKKLENIGPTDS